MKDLFCLDSYDYDLPEGLIAKFPLERREDSRLMLVNRSSGDIREIPFFELKSFLQKGDSLIFNDTKVIPARLLGKRSNGASAEVFLLKNLEGGVWEALVRPGKKLKAGQRVTFSSTFDCEILECPSSYLEEGIRLVRFKNNQVDFEDLLRQYGQMPLPQYLGRNVAKEDSDRYQTIFAARPGAVAAPTAGLHFSKALMHDLDEKGIGQVCITLHVGAGTFRPVQQEDIRRHPMHKEPFWIEPKVASFLNSPLRLGRQICVGTTSCRAIESATNNEGQILPGAYETSIFIYPGYQFRYVSNLLTNFHLPKSSLLMLVSALAGYELTREAYAKAIERGFRFYSYGDAMLIY